MEPKPLYKPEELTKALAAKRRADRLRLAVALLGLAACVAVCCFATRQNRAVTLPLTVGLSTAAGWIAIYLSHSRCEAARARVRHIELMLTGPRETYTGRFTKLDGVWHVKKGVSIRKLRQQEAFHETLLSVWDEKAARLPDEFEGAVETVYDCVAAFREDEP